MAKMTIEEALAALGARPGATIVSLTTWTRPALLKTHRKTGEPCPYPLGVEKITERYGIIGCSYENAVNNQRAREGAPTQDEVVQYFNAESLWKGNGEPVKGSKFLVRHKDTGKQYLCFLPRNQDGKPAHGMDRWRDVQTGKDLDPKDLVDYLPLPSKSKNQETEKEVFWRCVSLSNVTKIVAGETYEILPK